MTASLDGSLKVFDAKSARLLAEFRGHGAPVMALDCEVSQDGSTLRIVSASDDCTAKLWEFPLTAGFVE